jgi:hypothetical protein
MTFLSSIIDVECEILVLGDTLLLTLGSPLLIQGKFTYSKCNNNCTITEENGPALIKILRTGHEAASVTGEFEIYVHCGFFIDCRYNGEGLEGLGLGPLLSWETNGEVWLQSQELNRTSGSFCPETSLLDLITKPLSATYISS